MTVARRAALGRAREPAHGRRRRTASTCTARARRPSARSSGAPSRSSALFLPADAVSARARRRRVAQPRAATARTTRRARAAPTRSSTRCSCATPKRARSATASRATRCRRSRRRSTRRPARSVVVNPTARARAGLVEVTLPGHRSRARASTPTARARPTQVIGEIGGEAYPTMVTGQKVRWVLDLMRGTEFAGHDDHVVRRSIERRRRARHRAARSRARRRRAATSPSCASEMLELGDAGRHDASLRLLAAPLRRVLFDTGEIAGFGWSTLHAPSTATAPGGAAGAPRRTRRSRNEHLRVEVDAATGTYAIDDGRRRRASRASAGSSTAATAATPTTTRRPRDDRVDRHARRGARHDARDRPGARTRADRRRLHVARVRGRRRRVVHARAATRRCRSP